MADGEAYVAQTLFLRAKSGDTVAFADIVRANQRLVYSLALRMLGDPHKAEDLAQEVFMQLHRYLAQIESDAHLLFWLRKVSTNLAIDKLRREPRVKVVPLERDPGVESEATETDPLLQRRLRDLITELPPAPRAVVLLRYQEDMDLSEIAETLDMPVNTVKSHLRRSLDVLRERLA